MGMVQSQCLNGGAPDGIQPRQTLSGPGKMRRPKIPARVKETGHFATLGIDPREIRSLEIVAVKTSVSQIHTAVGPPCDCAMM